MFWSKPVATATYNFENATAGTDKIVNVTNITLENTWKANYELTKTSVTTKANITKAEGSTTVEISNWVYGNEPNEPVIESTTNNTDSATIIYEGTTFGGEKYGPTEEVPTDAGTYVVTVTIPGNENYEEIVVQKEVTIEKRTLAVSASAENKQYNGNNSSNRGS